MIAPIAPIAPRSAVIQPTTFCNLDCTYCYLPNRNKRERMTLKTAASIAEYLLEYDTEINVIFHGGEPLAVGFDYFTLLTNELRSRDVNQRLSFSVQTNGTLVDDHWAKLFKQQNISVGVSIDGEYSANAERINRSNKSSFDLTLKGIDSLNRNDVPFSTISVITKRNFGSPSKMLRFLKSLGSSFIGLNIENQIGTNSEVTNFDVSELHEFWRGVIEEWMRDDTLVIREIDYLAQFTKGCDRLTTNDIDLFPCFAVDGSFTLLSPEFLAVEEIPNQFLVGNVSHRPNEELDRQAQEHPILREHELGIQNCLDECEYFGLCGGGMAANKYFENRKISSTSTNYCRDRYKIPYQVFRELLEGEGRQAIQERILRTTDTVTTHYAWDAGPWSQQPWNLWNQWDRWNLWANGPYLKAPKLIASDRLN